MQEMHLVDSRTKRRIACRAGMRRLPNCPRVRRPHRRTRWRDHSVSVVEMAVPAEIPRLVLDLRGDQIPTRAPAADMVDRREPARDIVRLVIGRGRCRDQADMRRHRRQPRDQPDRFQNDLAPCRRPERAAAVQPAAAADRAGVLQEDRVQLAALGGAGHFDIVPENACRCWFRVRMPPARAVRSGSVKKCAKMQLRFHVASAAGHTVDGTCAISGAFVDRSRTGMPSKTGARPPRRAGSSPLPKRKPIN